MVGARPSSLNKSEDVPFVGTPSYRHLCRWIPYLDIDINRLTLMNTTSPMFEIDMRRAMFDVYDEEVRVIALGAEAYTAIKKIFKRNQQFYQVEDEQLDNRVIRIAHPSPHNYPKKDFVNTSLSEAYKFLHGQVKNIDAYRHL